MSAELQANDQEMHHKSCHINIYCCDDEKHPDKDCCKPEFAEVYSQQPQNLTPSLVPNAPGGILLFEKMIVATAGIDVSLAASLGQIKINVAGWYDVSSGFTGYLNPIPAPLPVFSVSLFQNGAFVDGSAFSNLPLSPAQGSNEVTADVFVYCNVGDILTFANTSTNQLFLAAPSLGSNVLCNSAYAKISLNRAGPK